MREEAGAATPAPSTRGLGTPRNRAVQHGSALIRPRADPRASNTGVTPPLPGPPPPLGAGLRSRFDWYEMTADGLDDGRVPVALALALGASVTPGKGRNGYGRADVLKRGEDVLAIVYGGSSRPGEVHVVTTGSSCDDVVPILRRLYPAHRVSRADAALDFGGDFDALDAQLVTFCTSGRQLKHELIVNSEGGATRYVGGRTSEVRLRLYKKSEQLRAQHPDRAHEIPSGIVRVEVQVRPGKRAVKEAAAGLRPDDLFGMGEWSAEYAREVLRLDPVRTATNFRRPSDWSRAVYFLGRQYGPMVELRVAERGLEATRLEVLRALGLSS
jgi:hypothetical protein